MRSRRERETTPTPLCPWHRLPLHLTTLNCQKQSQESLCESKFHYIETNFCRFLIFGIPGRHLLIHLVSGTHVILWYVDILLLRLRTHGYTLLEVSCNDSHETCEDEYILSLWFTDKHKRTYFFEVFLFVLCLLS